MGMYAAGYKAHETEQYIAAFERDGYVIIEDILSEQEVKNSVDEVWMYLERDGKVLRKDPNTWGNENWPNDICRRGGFVGKFPYWKRMKKIDETWVNQQPQSWLNRENPMVYNVFSNILKNRRLWVSIDRYGIMRPYKTQSSGPAGHSLNTDWQTEKRWLHWDLSPFHFGTSAAGFGPSPSALKKEAKYGDLRVQGLITLSDCREENGGFHCVPCFTDERFYDWANANRERYGNLPHIASRNFIEVPQDDDMRKEIRRVPMKAGSLLIWNSQLPHGNFPNSGHEFRMVQYIKMIPDTNNEFIPAMKVNSSSQNEWFPENYRPSELGLRLFGLEKWDKSP